MTVFKAFFQVARRNLTVVLIFIGMMMVITVLAFQSLGDTRGELKVSTKDYRVGIINEDGEDPLTRGLLDFLGARALLVPIGDGENDARDALFWRRPLTSCASPRALGPPLKQRIPLSSTPKPPRMTIRPCMWRPIPTASWLRFGCIWIPTQT